jgi:hypothetical protein
MSTEEQFKVYILNPTSRFIPHNMMTWAWESIGSDHEHAASDSGHAAKHHREFLLLDASS